MILVWEKTESILILKFQIKEMVNKNMERINGFTGQFCEEMHSLYLFT